MQRLYYATSNHAKFSEAKAFLQEEIPNIDIKSCASELEEIQTLDQGAVALHKAKQAWEILKTPVLVDDAGIYFEKYNQFPGVFTKFICQGLGLKGLLKLVNAGDKATFIIYLVYYNGPEDYQIFEANTPGSIVIPAGYSDNDYVTRAFPYDALFMPDGSNKTFDQLRKENLINNYNYRIKALNKFIKYYNSKS